MGTKIENQEQFEERIKYFVEKYSNDFNEKINVPGCDKAYVRTRFERDLLQIRQNEIYALKEISNAYHFRNQMKSLKGTESFEAIKEFCEKKNLKKDLQGVLLSLAEHDAILNFYDELVNQTPTDTNEGQDGNNSLRSLIKEKLDACKDGFNSQNDFSKAIKHLEEFLLLGKISIDKPLFVKNGQIRRLAFALGEIWRTHKNEPISYEYLCLYKQLFSIFKDQVLDKKNIFGCNLYKYSISKT